MYQLREQIRQHDEEVAISAAKRRTAPRSGGSHREEIAQLAYARWMHRGCPEGTADEDWYWAEREWFERRAQADLRPAPPTDVWGSAHFAPSDRLM